MFSGLSTVLKTGAIALGLALGATAAQAMPMVPNDVAPAPSGIQKVNDAPLFLRNGRVGNQAWGNGNYRAFNGNGWERRGWNGNRSWRGGRHWGDRRYYSDRRYYGGRRYYRDRDYGYGGFGLGLGSGLLLGSVIPYAEGPRYYAPRYRTGRVANSRVQWCYDRYRSYRASDNTYQPNYGPRRQCRAPF